MMIDHIASTVNLARSWLMTLDKNRIDTPVPTETLRLLLETVIRLGQPDTVTAVDDASRRTLMGMQAEVGDALKARDG